MQALLNQEYTSMAAVAASYHQVQYLGQCPGTSGGKWLELRSYKKVVKSLV